MSDVVETAEEFVEELPEVAKGGYGLGVVIGVGVIGAGIGAARAYFVAKRQLESKYAEQAAEEVAGMRETYRAKTIALENTVDKPALEEIIKEQGYSTEPPMAVTPPKT